MWYSRHMAIQLPQTNAEARDAYDEYLYASQDYWLDMRGDMDPPPPSYRMVDGKPKLGRFMDPWGCQGLMLEAQVRWHQWYPGFLTASAIGPVLSGGVAIFCILIAPFLAAWYLIKRSHFRRQYDRYYRIWQEIERTGQPVWVPYDRDRRKLIEARPKAVWP